MARQLEAKLTVDGAPALRVLTFDATSVVGQPAMFDVHAVFADYADLDQFVGKPAELTFGAVGDDPRRFVGVVDQATVVGSTEAGLDTRGILYTLLVVSPLALLSRSVDSRIYQEMTVEKIVTDVLSRHGISRVEFRLTASYPPREYCVQYQESALAFVSRLCEHEGIYSFVDVDDGGELLVFADKSSAAAPMDGDPDLPVRPRSAMSDAADAVYAVRQTERVRSGSFVLRDYDFQRPKLDLTSTSQAKERPSLEVYDYPGGYVVPAEGDRLAKVRLEAEQVLRRTVLVDATCTRIAAGHKLSIADVGDHKGEHFCFAVTHRFVHQQEGGGGGARYVAHARLLPIAVPYRPERRTPVPLIEGPQTATVVAPTSSPNQTIHTDKWGRCKVKFRWDRSEITDDKASCWMRVAQLQTSGSMMLPRIGWEVIVEFLEGDPDRPIIVGRLYNGTLMPPYALPEGKTRTAIKTASTPGGSGSNEIRFEDKAGSEEIMIHAEHDMKVVAANNETTSIGNNETIVVKNNASLKVGADETIKVTKGKKTQIGADQKISVSGNRKVEVNAVTALNVHGDAKFTVDGDQMEMDGNPLRALLALAAQAAEQFVASMADNAVAHVQAHVDAAVNQVMGPINALQAHVDSIGQGMQAVANGDLSAMAGVVASTSRLPGAAELAGAMAPPPGGGAGAGGGADAADGGGGGGGGGAPGGGGDTNALAAVARDAAHSAIHQGTAAVENALASALGLDGDGGGGEAGANIVGPAGDVAGVDQTDRTKGPGHSTAKITGAHTETIGGMKVLATIKDIDTNVHGNQKVTVGDASLDLSIANYAEKAGGSKTEKSLGLAVLSKAGESEKVGGSKTTMVGGLVYDKLKGSHTIEAGGPATFIGAFHKIEAKTKLTFKCGPSTVVVDGDGFTVKAPLVTILASKIQLPKNVAED